VSSIEDTFRKAAYPDGSYEIDSGYFAFGHATSM
jgi:hypothetical protein